MSEFIIDHSKKNIIVNGNLYKLGDNLVQYINEVGALDDDVTVKHVLTLKQVESEILMSNEFCSFCNDKCDHPKRGQPTFSFKWGYVDDIDQAIPLEELRQIPFENNLDSVVDYDSEVITLMDFIFPLIECIRKHYNSQCVYMVGSIHETTMVYVAI